MSRNVRVADGDNPLEPVQQAKRTKRLTATELFRDWNGGSYHAPDDYPAKGGEIDWVVPAGTEAW